MLSLNSLVSTMKGVGKAKEKSLKKLNIETVDDLLKHYPREYEDRTTVTKIADLKYDEISVILACVEKEPTNSYFKGLTTTRVTVKDDSGKIALQWFNQPYMKDNLKLGDKYAFIGKMTERKTIKRVIVSPDYEKTDENGEWTGSIAPIYPLAAGLNQKTLRNLISIALEDAENEIMEFIPFNIRKEYHLAERKFAIRNIHMPESLEIYDLVRRRLVFEELFMLQTRLLNLKSDNTSNSQNGVEMLLCDMKPFFDVLPFEFTNAQALVFNEISSDMSSGKAMNRLVQGDVGSGKTAVAMASAYNSVMNGYQAVMMAPTEVLALQHFESFKNIFEPLNIKVSLLVGGQKAKEKRDVLESIKNGESRIIVGTHALIQDAVEYENIGLVITDEQHRFGVNQRKTLSGKGNNPHVLVMTATPIPRTLALILYGDLDISIIDTLPPGRIEIQTFAVNTGYRQRIYDFIDKEIEKGRQAYVICSMVEENETIEAESVLEYIEILKGSTLNKRNIAYVHGKMKSDEKDEVVKYFSNGDIDILVATTDRKSVV